MSKLQPGELLTHHRCNKATGCGPVGCGQGIAYRLTRTGAKIPLDPVPVPDGDVALIGESDGTEGIAEILSDGRNDAYEGHLYASHYSKCKDGAKFRNSQPKRSPYPAPKGLDRAGEKLIEDQIKAHAAWFARECKEKELKTFAQVGPLFMEKQKKWWRDERNRNARQEWILRVRTMVREELGLAAEAAA